MGTQLPTKFPCWCRAIYSWGGETPKDLGFIEGDLIECLNAGDGSWWMGRLRRDKRMMGLFPSNFVVVLENNFAPISRSASPMPELQRGDSNKSSVEKAQERKDRAAARKPFHGYKTAKTPTGSITSSMSPAKEQTSTLAPIHDPLNPPSTVLWQQKSASRGPSRSASPVPHHEIGSSPPPPPPPHRVCMNDSAESFSRRTPSPQPQMHHQFHNLHNGARTPSPAPPSLNGHTPPMIRDAMDDVMSSLDDMTLVGRNVEPQEEKPFNPWSPEAFDNFRQPQTRPNNRPVTSLGLSAGASTYSEPRVNYSSRHNSPDRFQDGPPQLETYVQRMESRLRRMQQARDGQVSDNLGSDPPELPPKPSGWISRPTSAMAGRPPSLKKRKSAYELMRGDGLNRTFTSKTNSTNSSSGVQSNSSNQTGMTSPSIFSGYSASGFSATSAGSLARKRMGSIRDRITGRPMTSAGTRGEQSSWDEISTSRPITPANGASYQQSRNGARSAVGWEDQRPTTSGGLGGFSTPKAKRQGFFKKLIDSAKTGAASARSTIGSGPPSATSSPTKITGISSGAVLGISPKKNQSTSNISYGRDAAKEMGLMPGSSNSWVMTRRDVNRSNTPGIAERQERADRCNMLDHPVICAVDELYAERQGDENINGQPVYEPFQLSNPSFSQIDKAARFITSLPSSITAGALATGYVCRPYRSIVQRLRAIFIWCSERISLEGDNAFDTYGDYRIDTRRVIQSKRGNSQEVAALVMEMCAAIGVRAELVQGYLKTPGEDIDLDAAMRPNHWWNSVLVDGEWRVMDASLASPTNPKRSRYSTVSASIAEPWYFLARPSEICWTHVPVDEHQQRMIPAVSPDVLLALPASCPSFFKLGLGMHAYDTSIIRLEDLEVCTLSVNVPADVEIVAEVEARNFLQDQDGDLYEDTESVTRKRALAQPNWYRSVPHTELSQKRFVIKAVLPSDEGTAVLKIYAGKKGLMHSSRDIVHPLAFALPLYHTGQNPAFEFVKRHPTPHAMRQDLYVVQPQCWKLGIGETYVFCVRQHPSASVSTPAIEQNGFDFRPVSPNPMVRPSSALSMRSVHTNSQTSDQGNPFAANGVKIKDKPAKLAIQSPSGKILRLTRKAEGLPQPTALRDIDGEILGSVWESVVKVQERGTWRGLVLADRQARWCVWGEWEAV